MEEQVFTLRNQLDQIEPVQDKIKYVLQARGVRLKQIHAILLALGEWLENVVLHAYSDTAEHQIEVQLSVSENEVRLRITDDGRDFNLTKAPANKRPISLNGRKFDGRGIHLIHNLMDQVEHRRSDGKNRVDLSKHLIPPA